MGFLEDVEPGVGFEGKVCTGKREKGRSPSPPAPSPLRGGGCVGDMTSSPSGGRICGTGSRRPGRLCLRLENRPASMCRPRREAKEGGQGARPPGRRASSTGEVLEPSATHGHLAPAEAPLPSGSLGLWPLLRHPLLGPHCLSRPGALSLFCFVLFLPCLSCLSLFPSLSPSSPRLSCRSPGPALCVSVCLSVCLRLALTAAGFPGQGGS